MQVVPQRQAALVGREREVARLTADLTAAERGRGGAVAVIGEPGIGKTSLVSAITVLAHERGVRVLWGRCSDVGARTEWEPLAHALGALVDDSTLDAALAARCGAGLLAVVPDAAHVAPDLAPPAGADPETIAFSATRATMRLLRHVCLQRPCVLVIDDVHDADAASLRLLARLAREARTMSLLVVMTAREAELGARQRLTEVAELTRDLAIVRIGALGREASTALVARVASDLPPEVVERVLTAGDGNPLYLCELAALLSSRASVRDEELPIPIGIKASIRTRLDRLPADTRAIVEALAVLGGHAPIARVAAIAEVPTSASSLAFDLGIVVASGANMRMSHVLVRDAAYAELDAGRRTTLHRRAAEDASARAECGDHAAEAEQVRHLVACGATEDAVDVAIVAARAASARAADDEAVSILEIPARDLAAVGARRRAELAIGLGRALLRSGRSADGVAACTRATAIADQLGDADLSARAALARGSVFRFGHVDRGLVAALSEALERRGPREDAIHARLLARHAAAEQPSRTPWEPIARAHEAIALARRLGDDHVLLDVLHDGMAALVDFEHPRIRGKINHEQLQLARKMRATWYELRALNRLVFDHADLGRSREAEDTIEALDRVARSFAHPRHQWRVAMLRALRASSSGRWAEADRHLDEAIALGTDDPMYAYALFGHRLARLRVQERADELVQLLVGDEGDPLRTVPDFSALHAAARIAAFVRAGQLDRAREVMPLARECLVFDDIGFTSMFAEAAAGLGDRDACAALEPMFVRWTDRFVSGGPMFMYVADPAERYLGLVVSVLGDRARSIQLFETARARLQTAGSTPYLARTCLDLARVLETGTASERDRAAKLRAEAAELVDRFDLVDLRAKREPPPAIGAPSVPTSRGFLLVREGDAWAITSRDLTFRMRDSRGMRILAKLVEHAGEDLHALDLADGSDGTIDLGDAGVVLDSRARAEYRARLIDIRDDLADAERRGDLGWIERLRSEAEVIQAELSRAFAPGGRARRTGAVAERARSAVTRRVREAIAKIAEHDRELGTHLEWAVRTGMTCSYRKIQS